MRLPSGQFYGQTLRKQEAAGLILTESLLLPEVKLPKHCHTNGYFCSVRKGTFTETYGSRVRTCQPRTLKYHPAGEEHSEHFHNKGAHLFRVEATGQWLEHVRKYSAALDVPRDFEGGALDQLATKLYDEFLRMDECSILVIEGLALEIAAEASRHSVHLRERRPPLWLKHVTEILHEQFSAPPALATIARLVGVHPVHLSTAFRRHNRCTVGDYVRRLRIEFACHELSASRCSISEIAASAGFADHSHLSRTFKRHTGMTPAQYRAVFDRLR